MSGQDFLTEKVLLVLNPPYGKRIGSQKEITSLYKKIGQKIKNSFYHCGYAIIVPGLEAERALALRYDKKILFKNGGIKVALLIKFGT